jgi:hypothetical protein
LPAPTHERYVAARHFMTGVLIGAALLAIVFALV